MRHYLITAIILSTCTISIGQSHDSTEASFRDSLKAQIFAADQDRVLVDLLTNLADSYWVSKYDSAIFYARNGLLIARKIDYKPGEFNALLTLSLVSSELGDVVKGYEYSSMAISLSKEMEDNTLVARAYGAHGKVLIESGQYRDAIDITLKALTIPQLSPEEKFHYYIQLSDAYSRMEESDSADHFATQALDISKDLKPYNANANRVIGNMYEREGNTQQAIQWYRKALQAAEQIQDYSIITQTYHNLSRLYQQNKDSMHFYAQQMLATAEASRNITLIIKANTYLSTLHRPTQSSEALIYSLKASEAKDSLQVFIQDQSIRSFNDFEQKLKQLELEQATNELNDQLRQNTLTAGLLILSIIAFSLYRNNIIKQRGKKRVEEAYVKLKNTQTQLIQSEKMASLGELTAGIAHEIQNPLNFVNNFSELNIELLDEQIQEIENKDMEEAKAIGQDLKTNAEKIVHHGKRAEGIVKSMLQHSKGSEGNKEFVDINQLADEYLRLAYHGLRAKDKSFNATFKTNLADNLPEIEVIPQDVGRVFLNLINNAFYSVSEKSQSTDEDFTPTLEVSTRKLDAAVEISIRDNGGGIPQALRDKVFQPFFTTKATGAGTGLGLSLSYDIITKGHNGTIDLNSEEGIGTEFRITLPISF